MSQLELFKTAPLIRPYLNLGCLLDIPTGRYYKGKHGESILCGGLAYVTGIGGIGNTFKSTLAHLMALRAFIRYCRSTLNVYDTEISLMVARLEQLASNICEAMVSLDNEPRFRLTSGDMMLGDEWFDAYKQTMKARRDEAKKYTGTTPFLDEKGENIQAFYPFISEVDSFSQFIVNAVNSIYEANDIGESGMNIEALKAAAAKSQMMMQLPGLNGAAGGYMILTAHMGDAHQLDPRSPPAKKLAMMKQKIKFKNVPEKFTFLTNNCWQMLGLEVLINDTTKMPEFPRDREDDMKGDTDLMRIGIMNLRGKAGGTGLPFELIVSQSEGFLPGLSEFNYCRKYDRYGLGGSVQNYYLELIPEIKLSRTTIRGKITDSYQLQRALEITSEMCQMDNMWHDIEEGLLCTPKELYDDLKAKGYDWDVLLETRGYWVYVEDEPHEPRKFLSTMDLLNMRKGTYHPYWMEPLK